MSILNIIRQTNKPIAKQLDSIRTNGLSLLLSMIFIGLCYTTNVQAVTYANASTPYNWIDASSHYKLGPKNSTNPAYNSVHFFSSEWGGCGTTQPSIDDDITDPINIGFTFMYSGINFTQLRIMSNGRLQFGANNTTCGYGTPVTQIPYPIASLNYSMRIYGGDLDPSLQSDILRPVLVEAPVMLVI
jgi:MSHA biogenesis protein MshQ